MDSIEAIQRDYLQGQELQLNAFNRLLTLRSHLIPVAMHVQVELVDEAFTESTPAQKGE